MGQTIILDFLRFLNYSCKFLYGLGDDVILLFNKTRHAGTSIMVHQQLVVLLTLVTALIRLRIELQLPIVLLIDGSVEESAGWMQLRIHALALS